MFTARIHKLQFCFLAISVSEWELYLPGEGAERTLIYRDEREILGKSSCRPFFRANLNI